MRSSMKSNQTLTIRSGLRFFGLLIVMWLFARNTSRSTNASRSLRPQAEAAGWTRGRSDGHGWRAFRSRCSKGRLARLNVMTSPRERGPHLKGVRCR